MRLAGVLIAALIATASIAWSGGLPYMENNTPTLGRTYAWCDSVMHRKEDGGNTITVVLVDGVGAVRGEMDSVLKLWRAGGATPKFRRIQGVCIFPETSNSQPLIIDIFHSDGTSSNNKFIAAPEMVMTIPMEADSIHLTSNSINTQDFCICVW